jgi:hypothetical protein
MKARSRWFVVLTGLLVLLGLSGTASAQSSIPVYGLPNIGFQATEVESIPFGIHFAAEYGPTNGPYRETNFFEGVTSTEGGGAWAQRNNVWGICFNLYHCSGARILPDVHDFSFTLESSYQGNAASPTLIENNLNMRYADGTFHRPWLIHIRNEEKTAVLNFSSKPGETSFQVNQNGNTVIGNPFRQPVFRLEVVGNALITSDLRVDGSLTTNGLPVMVSSESANAGPMRWSISNGGDMDSPLEVCESARLECDSGLFPTGEVFSCPASVQPGVIFFALCR